MTATTTAVPAPLCPSWCDVHSGPPAWDVVPSWDDSAAGATKTCRREIEAAQDIDGAPVFLSLSRFADLDHGVAVIQVADVQITCTGGGRLSLEQAQRLAAQLVSLAEEVAR